MAVLLGNTVWEGFSYETRPPDAMDGQFFKELDTGETYIRRYGVWTWVNLGLSFIKATKSGRVTTGADGSARVIFTTPFSDDDFAVQLSCVDPEIGLAVLPFKRNLTAAGFDLETRVLPATAECYMMSNTASDVSGYKKLIKLSGFTAGAQANVTVELTTTPAVIGSWVTEPGYPGVTRIPVGARMVYLHAQRTSGSKVYYLYTQTYKRTSAGVETLSTASAHTSQIDDDLIRRCPMTASKSTEESFMDTDRLVLKIYGATLAGKADVAVLFNDWTTGSRVEFPTSPVPIGGIDVDWVVIRNYNP